MTEYACPFSTTPCFTFIVTNELPMFIRNATAALYWPTILSCGGLIALIKTKSVIVSEEVWSIFPRFPQSWDSNWRHSSVYINNNAFPFFLLLPNLNTNSSPEYWSRSLLLLAWIRCRLPPLITGKMYYIGYIYVWADLMVQRRRYIFLLGN